MVILAIKNKVWHQFNFPIFDKKLIMKAPAGEEEFELLQLEKPYGQVLEVQFLQDMLYL